MAVHRYDLAALADFSQQLGTGVEQLREQLTTASQAVGDIRANYDAGSAAAFEDTFNQWKARMEAHCDALVDFQMLVDNSHKNYSEAEESNTSMFGGGPS